MVVTLALAASPGAGERLDRGTGGMPRMPSTGISLKAAATVSCSRKVCWETARPPRDTVSVTTRPDVSCGSPSGTAVAPVPNEMSCWKPGLAEKDLLLDGSNLSGWRSWYSCFAVSTGRPSPCRKMTLLHRRVSRPLVCNG